MHNISICQGKKERMENVGEEGDGEEREGGRKGGGRGGRRGKREFSSILIRMITLRGVDIILPF